MDRAAAGVADEATALFSEISNRPIRSIVVLAGGGHNAADALIAAGFLAERNPTTNANAKNAVPICAGVKIILAKPIAEMSSAAACALKVLRDLGAQVHLWADGGAAAADSFLGAAPADLLLDGLLGYNFRPPLRGAFAEIIPWANSRPLARVRVSVDLPSGLGDAPPADWENVFRADATVACGIVKMPLLNEDPECLARRGRLRLADIGFPADLPGLRRVANAAALLAQSPLARLRPASSDKRHFGHLFILGGARDMPGALLMNVRAALRAGAGLVTAFCPESVHAAFAAAAPEAMWVPWPEAPDGSLALEGEHLLLEHLPRATALLCGSGMGAGGETQALLQSVAARAVGVPLVLDAGALQTGVLDAARRVCSGAGAWDSHAPLVLLPHAGEFVRIRIGNETTARQGCAAESGCAGIAAGDYVTSALLRETCAYWGAHIALKGSPTRVADSSGREVVVCAGGPVLARGGSGDLLAGIVGALFARRLFDAPLRTLATAVAWHGAAADKIARLRGAEAVATLDLLANLRS